MIRLSIVIPTYNRPKDIVERVGELLPQLVQGVDLLIIDNCSPVVVETLISENFPDTLGKITHIRNAVNIGGNANICRCFEVGNSDWIWLLGDDDSVKPDAIKMILAEITSHAEAISIIAGFNFSTGILQYLESYEFSDLHNYCQFSFSQKHFSNALFISSCVYQTGIARRFLGQAYQYMGSCAPQMVVALCSISNGFHWRTSVRYLVDWKPAALGQQWNTFYIAAGLPILIDVPGCTREVIRYIYGGLGITLWRPFLKGGIQMCLFNPEYGSKYWVILFNRIRPLLKGANRLKSEFLYWFAIACYRIPGFKNLSIAGFKVLRLSDSFDFNTGTNRN